jgi:hypothetical protein
MAVGGNTTSALMQYIALYFIVDVFLRQNERVFFQGVDAKQ